MYAYAQKQPRVTFRPCSNKYGSHTRNHRHTPVEVMIIVCLLVLMGFMFALSCYYCSAARHCTSALLWNVFELGSLSENENTKWYQIEFELVYSLSIYLAYVLFHWIKYEKFPQKLCFWLPCWSMWAIFTLKVIKQLKYTTQGLGLVFWITFTILLLWNCLSANNGMSGVTKKSLNVLIWMLTQTGEIECAANKASLLYLRNHLKEQRRVTIRMVSKRCTDSLKTVCMCVCVL